MKRSQSLDFLLTKNHFQIGKMVLMIYFMKNILSTPFILYLLKVSQAISKATTKSKLKNYKNTMKCWRALGLMQWLVLVSTSLRSLTLKLPIKKLSKVSNSCPNLKYKLKLWRPLGLRLCQLILIQTIRKNSLSTISKLAS